MLRLLSAVRRTGTAARRSELGERRPIVVTSLSMQARLFYRAPSRTRVAAEKADEEATVTSANLFSELMRLFPCSAEYTDWQHRRDAQKDKTASMCGSDAQRGGHVRARESVTQQHTDGYDWRRLFLVRAVQPPSRASFSQISPDAGPSCKQSGGAAMSSAIHQFRSTTKKKNKAGSADLFDAAGPHAPCDVERTPDLTDEGRAVHLWQHLVLSEAAEPSKSGACPIIKTPRRLFCWPQPAVYELYYVLNDSSCARMKPTRTPSRSSLEPSGCSSEKARKRIPEEREKATSRHHLAAAEKEPMLTFHPEQLCRVGKLHAIPGLPQPAPLRLPLVVAERSCDEHTQEWWMDNAEASAVASCPLLLGSVCSLHDYYTQLCDSQGEERTKTRTTEACALTGGSAVAQADEAATRRSVVTTTAAATRRPTTSHSRGTATSRRRHANGTKEQNTSSVEAATLSEVTSAQNSASFPPAPSLFPFPAFFGRDATTRCGGQRYPRDRWATGEEAAHTCNEKLLAEKSKTEDTGLHSSHVCPPCDGTSPTFEKSTSQLQPSAVWKPITHCWSAHLRAVAPPRSAQHWNCVPTTDFLRQFMPLHLPDSAGTTDGEIDGRGQKSRTAGDGTCVAFTALSGAAQTLPLVCQRVQDYGVGVLLVHEHEWVFFSLLVHTHRAVLKSSLQSSEVPEHGDGDWLHASSSAAAACSENLSHYYCFLHPPCEISVTELKRRATAQYSVTTRTTAQRTGIAPALPRSWLVHISTDVALHNTVGTLWKAYEAERTGCVEEDAAAASFFTRSASAERQSSKGAGHSSNDALPRIKDCLTSGLVDRDGKADTASVTVRHRKDNSSPPPSEAVFCKSDAENSEEDEKDGDSNSSCSHTPHFPILSAVHRKKMRQAREVELLLRYLHLTTARGSDTLKTRFPSSPSPSPWDHSSPNAALSSGGHRITSVAGTTAETALLPWRLSEDACAVSPFPSSTHLLKNRSFFMKPFVLAEEMKYGLVVAYRHAELVVPRPVRRTP